MHLHDYLGKAKIKKKQKKQKQQQKKKNCKLACEDGVNVPGVQAGKRAFGERKVWNILTIPLGHFEMPSTTLEKGYNIWRSHTGQET